MSAKKPLTILAGLIFLNLTLQIQAQGVAIHPTGAEAHSSAMLDISSTNMGLLIPRMLTEERNGIAPLLKA